MALLKAKHIVEEIDGVRCTIVEKEVSENRMNFLKELLELNKFEVKVLTNAKKTETSEQTYTVGVTNIIFNPVIAVYEKTLLTKEKMRVTPDYWYQKTKEINPYYWELKK